MTGLSLAGYTFEMPKTNCLCKIDPVGQLYASYHGRKSPNIFNITIHLKESINTEVLQVALDDLVKRLPFLNIKLKRGFFKYYHKTCTKPLKCEEERCGCEERFLHTGKRDNAFKVFYGERHLTLEAVHSVCDGRGMVKIASALLVRYFELQGIVVDKTCVIDCEHAFDAEETENAFERYGNNNTHSPKRSLFIEKAYQSEGEKTAQIKTHRFELDKLKNRAKKYNATVNEYVLACIFKAVADERMGLGCEKPISALIPIDCRNFLESKTLCNFVTAVPVTMPETEEFGEMIEGLRQQFKKFDVGFILSDITALHKGLRKIRFMPRIFKKQIFKAVDGMYGKGLSLMFSNIGLVKLPKEIESKVEMIDFVLGCNPKVPHIITCISAGNILSLTVKSIVKGDIFEKIFANATTL